MIIRAAILLLFFVALGFSSFPAGASAYGIGFETPGAIECDPPEGSQRYALSVMGQCQLQEQKVYTLCTNYHLFYGCYSWGDSYCEWTGIENVDMSYCVAEPAPTVSLSADPSSIIRGNNSTLSWTTSGAAYCWSSDIPSASQLDNGDYVHEINGSTTVSPSQTQSYTMSCQANVPTEGGSTGQSQIGSDSTTVTVSAPAPTPTVSLSANPTSIVSGQNSTLAWSSNNATSCSGSGFNTGGATSGSVSVSPNSTTNYSVTCTGAGGSASDSAKVSVSAPAPTVHLSAIPSSITQGDDSTLSWSSNNATSCSGSGFNTGGATSGSVSVSPNSTTNYSVTCTGAGGSASDSAKVRVSPAPPAPTVHLSANPDTITRGERSLLQWSSSNATSCSGSGFNTGGATSGALNVYPKASTTYSITCTGAGGTANDNATVNVLSPALPDLTASTGAAPSGEVGQSLTFSATIHNQGNANVGSHNSMLQICGGATGDCRWQDRSTVSTASIAAGNSRNISATDSVSSPGTHRYRYCADMNSSYQTSVAESNEGNNCGAWRQFTVSNPTPPANVSFSANPTDIVRGESSTLSWSSSNATSCTGSGFNTGGRTTGSQPVSPNTTTTYSITCTGPGGSDSESAQVTVYAPTTASLTASPQEITRGDQTTLSWSSTGATGCTGSGFSTQNQISGSVAVSPNQTATYQLRCQGPGGRTNDFEEVRVVQPSISLTADDDRVQIGDTTVLRWEANDVRSCIFSGPGVSFSDGPSGPGSGDFSGDREVTITQQSTFVAECQATGGPVSDEVIVNVVPEFEEF